MGYLWADVEGNSVKAACGSLLLGLISEIMNHLVLIGNITILHFDQFEVSDSGYYYCIGTYRTQSGMIAYFKKSFVLYVWKTSFRFCVT